MFHSSCKFHHLNKTKIHHYYTLCLERPELSYSLIKRTIRILQSSHVDPEYPNAHSQTPFGKHFPSFLQDKEPLDRQPLSKLIKNQPNVQFGIAAEYAIREKG